MTKCCPIMSKREQTYGEVDCIGSNCAFWDEEREQCCIKSAMIAAADKKNGGPNSTAQAVYIPARPTTGQKPQDYRYNSETGDPNLADQYIFNGGL